MQPQKPGPHAGMGGMVSTEEHRVPDKMVGLIIGKGGEQIMRLQAETGCKVQIAPDSGGMPDRPCTLTGSPMAIMSCKQAIQQIIERGQGLPQMGGMDGMGEGSTVVEINIPGTKVGLIIGKGGETIRQLQERAGVKMVMIQDSNAPSAHDKPLRITGELAKCQRAKELVLELLAEKDGMPRSNAGGYNDFGTSMGHGGGSNFMDIAVPRQGVGLVIGKGGDMIKKIQTDTGAKVQFKPDDGQSQDRLCSVTGSPDKVSSAVNLIQELLAKANIMGGQPVQNFGGSMGPGPGNDMGRIGPGNGPFSPPGRGGMGGRFDPNFQDHTTFVVPADKCGLVIGKGGETIREINRQSGAHVELDRNPPPNINEKLFNIRGNPAQIQHAIQLIQEKTGQQGGHTDSLRMTHGPGGGPGGVMGGPGGPNGPPGGPGRLGGPGGPGPQGPGYDQFGGQFGQPNQPVQQQQQQPQQQQYGGTPQTWNAYGNQYPQQQNIANKQPNDAANAAAWAAYYYATYGQGQPAQQHAAPQQPAAPQQQQQPAQSAYPQPTINPQTGQPDYSQAWIEYYRSQGMFHEANMVLQQVQSQAAAQAGQPGQP